MNAELSPEMTRAELEEAIEQNQTEQTNRILRWIILMVLGGCGSILAGGIVWGNLNTVVVSHTESLGEIKPKVAQLESWKERMDATRVTPQEAAALDKRLQRVEDQNVAIMEALERIDAKLK
jgi:hypothetical protein